MRARCRGNWDQSPRKTERVPFPAGGTRGGLGGVEGEERESQKEKAKKENHPRAPKPCASQRARGLARPLQLEVIVRAGVCVARTTARPAPAEGGAGWVNG